MASFTLLDDRTTVTEVTLRTGGRKRLHLAGVGADKSALQVLALHAALVTPSVVGLFDGPKGIWTVELLAKQSKGKSEIQAKVKGTLAAKLGVTVVDRVDLPSADTTEGLLVRLLLAESRNPDQSGYDAANSKTSMQWMRLVLVNRLNNNPAQFNAPGATEIKNIVTAKGQFEGFEEYPKLSSKVTGRLGDIVRIANDDSDGRQEKFARYLQDALDVAKSPTLPADPCPTKLFGWRTAGSSSPGGRFVAYDGPLAGNQFYTLK